MRILRNEITDFLGLCYETKVKKSGYCAVPALILLANVNYFLIIFVIEVWPLMSVVFTK